MEIAEQARGSGTDVAGAGFQLRLHILKGGIGEEQDGFPEGFLDLHLPVQETGNVLLLDLSRGFEGKNTFADEDGAGGAVQHGLEEVEWTRI